MEKAKQITRQEAAALGCYVYCYLRSGEAKTPYYVGIASTSTRPIDKRHSVPVPAEEARIRIMRSGLTWEQAGAWEQYFIARFGRKDNNTGILRNLTDGGDGALGVVPSEETRQKMASSQKGRKHSQETKAKMRQAAEGRAHSEETRKLFSEQRKGRPSKSKGVPKSKSSTQSMIRTQSAPSAAKLKVSVDWYAALPKLEKIRARRASKQRGIFGQDLVVYMQTRHDGEGKGRPKKIVN